MWPKLQSLGSLVPWHTSHRVNLDAKGVPQEIKISVSGLPNIRNIGIDVDETTRNAWICVLYSLAFLFASIGVYLLVGACIHLVCGVHVAIVNVLAGALLLITTISIWLHWLGLWNVVVLCYMVVIEKSEHIQSCKCPFTPLKNGGKLPLCGIVWLACVGMLVIQILMKGFRVGVGMIM